MQQDLQEGDQEAEDQVHVNHLHVAGRGQAVAELKYKGGCIKNYFSGDIKYKKK